VASGSISTNTVVFIPDITPKAVETLAEIFPQNGVLSKKAMMSVKSRAEICWRVSPTVGRISVIDAYEGMSWPARKAL